MTSLLAFWALMQVSTGLAAVVIGLKDPGNISKANSSLRIHL